jgi:hypothetical protein
MPWRPLHPWDERHCWPDSRCSMGIARVTRACVCLQVVVPLHGHCTAMYYCCEEAGLLDARGPADNIATDTASKVARLSVVPTHASCSIACPTELGNTHASVLTSSSPLGCSAATTARLEQALDSLGHDARSFSSTRSQCPQPAMRLTEVLCQSSH